MRSIFVRVEPTVRLVRVGEGVVNTDTLPWLLMFGLRMTEAHLI
jgi:hypothetical protein